MPVYKRKYKSGTVLWFYKFSPPGSIRGTLPVRAFGFATKREAEDAEAQRRVDEQQKFDLAKAGVGISAALPKTIYDHQKAGTDIPQMGRPFAKTCREAGVDGIIIFPQAGPRTLEAFVSSALENDLVAIVGIMMTHPGYLASDGGYLIDTAPSLICDSALRLGATHFVLPGTNPTVVRRFSTGPLGDGRYTLWMPGIGAQGGCLGNAFEAALPNKAVGIIGSSIYASTDPKKALEAFASEITP